MLKPPEVATVQFKPHARWKMTITAVTSYMGTRPETGFGKQPDPGISRYPAHKSETYKGKLVTEQTHGYVLVPGKAKFSAASSNKGKGRQLT